MTTIEKIQRLLQLGKERKFYAEAKLDDGRLIVTEAENLEVGAEVFIMTDEGTSEEIDNGEYAFEDGTKMLVEGGRITRMGDEATDEAEDVIDELAEEIIVEVDEEKDDMRSKLMSIGLADDMVEKVVTVIKELYPDEETEDMGATMEAMAQATADSLGELLKRIETLEQAPASEGIQKSPNNLSAQHKSVDLSKFNGVDRALQIINSHR